MPISGTYQIDYDVNLTAGVGSAIAISVNTTADASTSIDVLSATGEVNGTAMLTFTAGDTMTLRNNSATPFTMDTVPGVGAQFDVILLS